MVFFEGIQDLLDGLLNIPSSAKWFAASLKRALSFMHLQKS